MVNYKEITKALSKSVAAILSSTGSYTSSETPSNVFYDDNAKKALEYEGVKRNPVILIHGFFGSNLIHKDSGVNLWGNFDITETVNVPPEKMNKIAHPMELGKPINEIEHQIEVAGLLEEINIQMMGFPVKLPAYKDMVDILIKGGFHPENYEMEDTKNFNSLFLFAYDWRCDMVQNAKKLHTFIKEKRLYIQEQYEKLYGLKNYDVQFDVIAHSMGGLISRYFLRYGSQDLPTDGSMPNLNWSGAEVIDRMILLGTPNAGYLDTLLELLHGSPIQPYPPTVLGTLPSYYQMFPPSETQSIIFKDNAQAIDIFDIKLWIKMNWGLADVSKDEVLQHIMPDIRSKEKRREIALDHLKKCLCRAKQFIKAMSIPAQPSEKVSMHAVCGTGIKTTRKAEVNSKTGEVEVSEYGTGDGKILLTSVLWDERATKKQDGHFMTSPIKWSNIMLLRAAHMGITKAPGFEDNLLFLLTMKESLKQKTLLKDV